MVLITNCNFERAFCVSKYFTVYFNANQAVYCNEKKLSGNHDGVDVPLNFLFSVFSFAAAQRIKLVTMNVSGLQRRKVYCTDAQVTFANCNSVEQQPEIERKKKLLDLATFENLLSTPCT